MTWVPDASPFVSRPSHLTKLNDKERSLAMRFHTRGQYASLHSLTCGIERISAWSDRS